MYSRIITLMMQTLMSHMLLRSAMETMTREPSMQSITR